ncbi:MAG: helix-turn-helix domain-containing protein [Candidatus Marsarchaeota archaeon]|nr:helix-turn-helix domain-containing protein [Candidatus Marsarchaeota archaeon]
MGEKVSAPSVAIAYGPLLLTITEVSALLNLGRTKTYELIMGGRTKSVKLGRKRLVPKASVERYVSEISAGSTDDWS